MTAPVFDSSSLPFVEEMLARWQQNPADVDREWQAYFSGWMAASGTGGQGNDSLYRYTQAWRTQGYNYAHVNPLAPAPEIGPELKAEAYNLTPQSLPQGLAENLRRAYGGTIGVEVGAVQNAQAREWTQQWFEAPVTPLPAEQKQALFQGLLRAGTFEKYLHTKFIGAKRFSLEGNEAFIPLLLALVPWLAADGVQNLLVGMAHRGRLNALCNVFHKPYAELMAGFAETLNDANGASSGDVKYHLGKKYTAHVGDKEVNLSLAYNPSHLEAVNPVVAGAARALREAGQGVLPLLVHGDASIAGQGVVPELYNFAGVPGYDVGGTIHVVLNNQIGFTAEPRESLSGAWCTDNFRATGGPIVHVNADDPEACLRAFRFAYEYRQKFTADVMLDIIGYRRWGHNEGDDPTFTQPLMYAKIRNHPTVAQLYAQQLSMSEDDFNTAQKAVVAEFDVAFAEARNGVKGSQVASLRLQPDAKPAATATTAKLLGQMADAWHNLPSDFTPNDKVHKVVEERVAMLKGEKPLNWGAAETAAYGALLAAGTSVRISGEDAQRGTFSHRHGTIVCQQTGKRLTPLNALANPREAKDSHALRSPKGEVGLAVYNSPLSEYAAMGFEYGYALEAPETLTIWEGQFGDFANGAQIVIDQFLAAAGAKWGQSNGLTLLLPHGYEGQGPEHSSARVERFLQLCAENNLTVAMPSTPAQIFHLLRRQALQRQRVPLVVFTPKSLLRLPAAVSPVSDLTQGTWQPVIGTSVAKPKRILLCAGKVYYNLLDGITQSGRTDIAVLRLEQFYPFPAQALQDALQNLGPAKRTVHWVQEEPRNMGAWSFVRENWNPDWGFLHYIGRPASASPAVGTLKRHNAEQAQLINEALDAAE